MTTPTQLHPDRRDELLSLAIQEHLVKGWRLESRNGPYAIVERSDRSAMHPIHLVLIVVTCGLWLALWIPALLLTAARAGRVQLYVDEHGAIVTTRARPVG